MGNDEGSTSSLRLMNNSWSVRIVTRIAQWHTVFVAGKMIGTCDADFIMSRPLNNMVVREFFGSV